MRFLINKYRTIILIPVMFCVVKIIIESENHSFFFLFTEFQRVLSRLKMQLWIEIPWFTEVKNGLFVWS